MFKTNARIFTNVEARAFTKDGPKMERRVKPSKVDGRWYLPFQRRPVVRKSHNLVVDAGLNWIRQQLSGSISTSTMTWVASGTGTTPPAAGDTALQAEVGSRVNGTVTNQAESGNWQVVATLSYSASYAITESGVFSASTAGTMLARQTFSAINVANGDSIQFTWTFDVDAV